ncbi:pentatricopeptide repeat-containing protein At4g18840-like [Fagus crenata]
MSHAVYVFDCLAEPDAFLCNTIMRSYVNSNDPCSALGFYYGRMIGKWVSPNHDNFPLLVKVVKFGFESDLFVRNSLIHLYSVCGRIGDARMVFDAGPDWDLVSWNTMIDGYVKNGEVGIARELFDEMNERDLFSWNSMISGYVGIGDMEAAKGLIGNVLVARYFFDQMPLRNVVSWNMMLALYVWSKDYNECLRLFDSMIEGGEAKPNEATLVNVLTACANLGSLDRGKWVHSCLKNNGIKPDVLLSMALLTMYAKCGAMEFHRIIQNCYTKTYTLLYSEDNFLGTH